MKKMSRDEILIRVSDGEKIPGYKVIQLGIDASGKYKKIETPEGSVEKVYCMGLEDLEKAIQDKYNRIHNYRRQDDTIVFHYNIDTGDLIVLPVMAGDDLSKYPFNLKESFIVSEEMLGCPTVTPRKGIVPITQETIEKLKKMNILSETMAHVLFFNRKNAGFYF